MKKVTIIISLFFCGFHAFTQNQNIEEEIKKLEQMEVRAVLSKDTAVLKKLWDPDYVVHNPNNKIVLANANPVDRPVLNMPRADFTRTVEHITVKGDVVFSMGSETVVPAGDAPKSGQTIKRRYTNIWMKINGEWKLVARHANVICQGN
jgi:ketosteroid isomerase-like protein